MIFASTELAARIEAAECGLLRGSAESVAVRRPEVKTLVRSLAGGVATFAGASSPLNKIAGLGFAGPVDPEELADVEARLARRGAASQVELSTLAEASIAPLLSSRGYVLRGFENVSALRLPTTALDRPSPRIVVEESPRGDVERWLEILVTGFGAADEQGVPTHETPADDVVREAIRDMAVGTDVRRFTATIDGEPAGGASLRLEGGIAQLCGAATLPAQRRQGVQTALLAHRLSLAARAGCDLAVVTTQPGSKSAENVRRLGFELLYARAILVRNATSPAAPVRP